ncbi:epithelial-stromal interaction protein 1 isoform X2 [Dunckerocampus dactyliophorus]|uniref:epithelial-stromal interaction protein 1 isoform X2 n=1 Tax=Dunckerocampus dactyliophorus TaxID=161453 RepID=UPI0024064841|nr:epithelial-stromal interaction protein 1 isoform X2 [Dunckerocampus dactyliophorus]
MDGHRFETSTDVGNSKENTSDSTGVDRRTQSLGGVTMIPPNESRRNQARMMAQKEEEELQKWKESQRLTHVCTTPERLGGDATLAQVRERQYKDLRCSKVQKKLKQEILAQKKRQEEDDEFQRKKDEQRKKAERHEERKQVVERSRQERLRQDNIRVTSIFLDKLDCRRRGGSEEEPKREEDSIVSTSDDCCRLLSSSRGQEHGQVATTAFLIPEPDRVQDQEKDQDLDQDQDLNWALMKLVVNFPEVSQVFLEDILTQCNDKQDGVEDSLFENS